MATVRFGTRNVSPVVRKAFSIARKGIARVRRLYGAKKLGARVVSLSDVPMNPECEILREWYRTQFSASEVDKKLNEREWRRLSFVLSLLPSQKSFLDVGTGQGQLIRALHLMKAAERIVGIDIHDYKYYKGSESGFEHYQMDASQMTFSDGEFETVTCMEVIEHLRDDIFTSVISELHRVTSKTLIVSVPFMEKPLLRYHLQYFNAERIKKLFPGARYTLMDHWLLIEDRHDDG